MAAAEPAPLPTFHLYSYQHLPHLCHQGLPAFSDYGPRVGVSSLGWPLPSAEQWPHVGTPGWVGPEEARFRPSPHSPHTCRSVSPHSDVAGQWALTLRMAGRKLCARRLRLLRSRWKPRSSSAEAWGPLTAPWATWAEAGGCCCRHRLVRTTRSRSHRSSCMAWGSRQGKGHGGAQLQEGRSRGPWCQGLTPGCTAEALHPPHTHAMQQQCTAGPPTSPGPHACLPLACP
jgi:hypothetical protein